VGDAWTGGGAALADAEGVAATEATGAAAGADVDEATGGVGGTGAIAAAPEKLEAGS
jgi:hypothetical protein